jgi:hypothetical protein
MKCLDSPLKYTGQTFHTRYKEHIQVSTNTNGNLGYSNHVLNVGHTYGTRTDTKTPWSESRANYTDQATAAFQRSDCQLLRIEGATWST